MTTDARPQLTAYHRWLLKHYQTENELASRLLYDIVEQQNPQAFDLLNKTGDKIYNQDTFLKAARLLKSWSDAEQ